MDKALVYLSIKYNGDWHSICQFLKDKQKLDWNEVNEVVNKLEDKWITILSDEYPESLKNIYEPPIVLFYKGDISLLKSKSMAVIGSRKADSYGLKMCSRITTDLVKGGYNIVSGLAIGIDRRAHSTCIDAGGKTIAVLGYGINYVWEDIHEKVSNNGLIISEYPADTPPSRNTFLFRNRLIAGLSVGVVVAQAKLRSGTMNTVAYALDQGKDIFAVPYKGDEESGCNMLIKQGAKLVENAKDVLEELL